MHLRLRRRGTNQHQVRASLEGVGHCKEHGFYDTEEYIEYKGFVEKKRNDVCPKCKSKDSL